VEKTEKIKNFEAPLYPWNGVYPELGPEVFIAPGAVLIGRVFLGARASIWAGAVLRGDINEIRIGDDTNIQDNSVCHVDDDFPCIVGKNVVVGHSVILHGCTIADRVLVGMGSIIMNGAIIRKHSLVAAGSLIPEGKEYPEGSLIIGRPGRILRKLRDDEIKGIYEASIKYVEVARKHRESYGPQ